jgi:shikimate kinase
LDTVRVLEPRPETTITSLTSTLKLVTEDALLITEASSNVEDTVDQTTMTRALKLMLNAQEHHGSQTTSRLDQNSESPVKDGLKESAETSGDH